MKKYRISFVLMFQILLLSLGVGVLSFCLSNDVSNAAASEQIVANRVELKTSAPENLEELQKASDVQLEEWTKLKKFDGREYEFVTSQKAQGSNPICWAYAATGLAEVSVLRQGLALEGETYETLDFDEMHVAWASKNMDKRSNPLGLMKDDVNTEIDWNIEGYLYDALYTMTDGYSPIPQQSEGQHKKTIESRYIAEQVLRIDESKDAIKKAILKYGGVGFSYNPRSAVNGYFYDPGKSTSHVSVIVGWDDSINKSNFTCTSKELGTQKAQSDGAWIVKNSWSRDGGANAVNGIHAFYMSYESHIGYRFALDMALKEDYPNIYQYDGSSVNNRSNVSYIEANAAIYEAKLSDPKQEEYLKAIQVGFTSQNVDLNIDIYRLSNVNPANVNDKINDPTIGKRIHHELIHFEKDGFFTINLNTKIPLKQGEYFSIVLYDTNYNDLHIMSGVDRISTNDMTFYRLGGEWYNYKYSNSYDYADQADIGHTARIRAITETRKRESSLDEKDLQYARIEIDNGLFYYKKDLEQKPEITVSIGDLKLEGNRDYNVTISDDTIHPGTKNIKITGINPYHGLRTTVFEIAKPYLPNDLPAKNMTVYNNVTKLADIPLPEGWEWLGGQQLKDGKNTYTAKYVGADSDCYLNKMFDLSINKLNVDPPEKISISDAKIVIDGAYTYTGKPITPNVTVTLNGKTLNKGTDYNVVFSNNTYAGTATVTITGIGLYKGSLNKYFEINKADYPANRPDGTKNVSRRITKLSEIQLPTDWIWKNSSLTITKDVFTATAEYTGSDKQNYINTEVEITVTRAAKVDISTINVTYQRGNFVYDNGNPIEPTVVATDGGYTLLLNSDFNVAYQNNINAGQGTIVITGIGEYYTGTKIVKFEILKAEKPDVETTIKVNNQIQELSDINPPESFEWIEGSLEVVSENGMTARARYVGEDAENYTNTEVTFEIIIDNATEKPEKSKTDANILWWGLGIGGGISMIGIVGWLISRKKKK